MCRCAANEQISGYRIVFRRSREGLSPRVRSDSISTRCRRGTHRIVRITGDGNRIAARCIDTYESTICFATCDRHTIRIDGGVGIRDRIVADTYPNHTSDGRGTRSSSRHPRRENSGNRGGRAGRSSSRHHGKSTWSGGAGSECDSAIERGCRTGFVVDTADGRTGRRHRCDQGNCRHPRTGISF